jgi:bleomycin hydrolase
MKKIWILLFAYLVSHTLTAQDNPVSTLPTTWQNEQIIAHTPVKDQYYSGTCWSFASLSFLESEIIRIQQDSINLSEMFVARQSYFNKINEYLKRKGDNYFTPGGQVHDVLKVITENGIITEEAYSGLAYYTKHYHPELDTLVKYKTEQLLQEEATGITSRDMGDYCQAFDKFLGEVPQSFSYKGKEYTPKTFAQDYLKVKAEDYITITSYDHHPFYQGFVLEDPFNWLHEKYQNLPIDEWQETIDYALKNGYSLAWNGDVSETTFEYENGIAYLSASLSKITQETRQQAFADTSTKIDHVMHIIGKAKGNDKKTYYYIKNSWGTDTNSLGGYLYMSLPYLLLKTSSFTIHKDGIPPRIRKKLKIE